MLAKVHSKTNFDFHCDPILCGIHYLRTDALPAYFLHRNMARQKSQQPGSQSFEDWMAQLNAMYNMDKNIVPGYFSWLGTAIRGEFGESWFYTVPVLEKFNDCIWLSFVMGAIAFFFEIIIAVPLGVIAATKQYSRTDYTIQSLRWQVSRCLRSSSPRC